MGGLLGLLFPLMAAGQIVTLVATNDFKTNFVTSITIPSGQSVVAFWGIGGGSLEFQLKPSNALLAFDSSLVAAYPVTLAGPLTVTLKSDWNNNATAIATLRIVPDEFDVGQTVIVPAGTAATIHFEESFDLKTWSNTFTTNYTAGSTNRFFRLRAVRQ